MQSTPTSSWLSPEAVSQAGAGALLVAVAVAELCLAFWAAGWWHRSAGAALVIVGAALLARAVAVGVARRRQLERAVRTEELASTELSHLGLVVRVGDLAA